MTDAPLIPAIQRVAWMLAALIAMAGSWSAGAQAVLHPTAASRYQVAWSCQPVTPAQPHILVCVVHVEDASGQPVAGLDITMAARPPGPGHGLPLQPQVTAYLGQGNYRVERLGPLHHGRWVLGFRIARGAVADSVAFEADMP